MPVTREDLEKGTHVPKLKILANGGFGSGKTYFAMTFPKWAYAMIEPNGITTALSNKNLLQNMVYYDEFVPAKSDIKKCFMDLTNFIAKAKQDALDGKIETFILDNLTHLSENRWLYIDQYEPAITKGGKKDTLSQYGNLGRWMYKFVVTEILSLPCHVVVTVHEQDEEEEQMMKDGTSKRVKTGNVITNTLGGFRNDAAGLFNASIFLESRKVGPNQYKYQARCQKGGGKLAKNNLNLPEIVEDISFSHLMEAMGLNKKKEPLTAGGAKK